MSKAKSRARVMVPNGAGGSAQIQDRRFEGGDWPLRFDVPKEVADVWLQYLSAECRKQGWSCASLAQLQRSENSGSITINTGAPGHPQLAVVWARKRDGPIEIRARSVGAPEFPLGEAGKLFERVSESCKARATQRFYRRGQLEYDRLAWRGELWLDDTLRLGPPTVHDEQALLGPRVVIVDAQIDGIDESDVSFAFEKKLRELSVFLSVVMGCYVHPPEQRRAWTWSYGSVGCEVRQIGYLEQENPQRMPSRGACRPVAFNPVSRPDFSIHGIDGSANEQSVPSDVPDLWAIYCGLPEDRRGQFLQAGAKYQQALLHWREERTLSYALMVVACEALKPADATFRDHNIYHVVQALLGKATAEELQQEWFRAQDVRSAHLHRGEFRGSEFVQHMLMSSYQDPTFDQARFALARVTQATIIEWLRGGGTLNMPPLVRKRTLRRWLKEHALLAAILTGALGTGLGLTLGRFVGALRFPR